MDQQNTVQPRQQTYSDEVDLFELWDILVKKKWLICTMTAVFTVVSLIIAYTVQPVYKASAHFLPPLRQSVELLNVEVVGVNYSKEDLYAEFQRNFRSRAKLWEFFFENELYNGYLEGEFDSSDINHVFDREFIKDLVLVAPASSKGDGTFVSATFNWHDKKEAANLLNNYVQLVAKYTSMQFLRELESLISNRKARLGGELSALKYSAENAAERKVQRLDEDIFIARKLGIKRSSDSRGPGETSSIFVDASDHQPYYYLGYEVLEVEREAILNRKSVEPFVPGLEEKLKELDYLSELQLPAKVEVVRISRSAEPPKKPIKPNKKLIVAIGFILGGFFGVVIAFIVNAAEGRREAAF